MCRHFAYVGEPVTIQSLLSDPPHSLVEQAWRPRRQRHGTMNVDGFGVGWFADADPVPARYRKAGPIWSDDCLADLARVTRTRAMLCAVRSASVGTDMSASAVAPYTDGTWLFSLNGALVGWSAAAGGPTTARRKPQPPPGLAGALARAEAAGEPVTEPAPVSPVDSLSDAAGAVLRLAELLPPAELLGLQARCDTALLWAMVRIRLRAGEGPGEALAGTIADITQAGVTGRFNMLLTNGEVIAATAAGDTLCYRRGPAGVIVASEPADDETGWHDVPAGSVVKATPAAVVVRPLLLTTPQADRFAPVSLVPRSDAEGEASMTSVQIDKRLPDRFFETSLRADVLAGLTASPKSLPPKWFYDERGSELFDKITMLDEYYPTRAEREILASAAGEIAAATRPATLVELGSGSADKTRLLLDAMRDAGTLTHYVPVDVSESALVMAAKRMQARYRGLHVQAVLSDFTEHLGLPDSGGPRLVVFLGGTIGNLLPGERADFLRRVRAGLRDGDALLLGTDLVKDPAVLVAAYDDAAGVTAEFNKNILRVLNAELGANFDLEEFDHVALWDAQAEWIEMRLRSAVDQTVLVPAIGLSVPFLAGEEMRTEISAKFRREGVAAELAAAGLSMRSWWTDSQGRFGLSLAVPL